MRKTTARTRVFLCAAALSGGLSGGGMRSAEAQQLDLGTYEARLAAYRSGEFVAALRASAAFPIDQLRDEAEEFFHTIPGRSRGYDRTVLAAAMLHFDLAGAAGMDPEKNESLGRNFLSRATDGRRSGWLREAHLGLLGLYVDRGQLDHAVRAAKFLGDAYREDRVVDYARARLAEFIGWGFHDERFLDQAEAAYEDLLPGALAGEEGAVPVDLRLRIAHLTLRGGDPEEALEHLEAAGVRLTAVQRFVASLLRGETLLWLGQPSGAEAAFAEAQAIHFGSVSAAAGLAAARMTRGNTRGAAEAVRGFLSASRGRDTWWSFLVDELAAESARLDQLRGLIRDRD